MIENDLKKMPGADDFTKLVDRHGILTVKKYYTQLIETVKII